MKHWQKRQNRKRVCVYVVLIEIIIGILMLEGILYYCNEVEKESEIINSIINSCIWEESKEVINSIISVDSKLEQLSGGKQHFYTAMKYHCSQPSHFLMYIDIDKSNERCQYRNIDTSNLLDEYGDDVDLNYKTMVYVADTVLDKYIREYGGKDGLYNVEEVPYELPENIYHLAKYKVYGEDVCLNIIFSYYINGLASVFVENMDYKETEQSDFITYSQYGISCNEKKMNCEKYQFCMTINPKITNYNRKYRNVNPCDNNLNIDDMGYYIADQVIDKYIRDYRGADVSYNIILFNKNKDEKEGSYVYFLHLKVGEEILKIQYSENSWLVSVEIQGSEMDLGVASQKEIDSVAQMENVRKLRIALADDNMDLTPLKNLKELEELSIIVNSESKELDFSFFSELTHLKKLYIYEGYGEWSFLENLKELEELVIMRSEVDSLSFLQELTQLREVSVYWVNDADIENLKKLDKLEYLYIEGCNVRNTECLTAMKNINTIHLAEMQSTPTYGESIYMGTFSEMNKLERLYLIRMRIEDITPISELPSIETLVLVDTGIESIQSLENLPKLKELKVYGENSEEIENEARKYLPNLESIVIQDEIPSTYEIPSIYK